MRYVFRIGVAFALGLALMVGCSDENGEGGNGGTAGTGGIAGHYCESNGECDSGVCGDPACFLAACGVCECGQPDCSCFGYCECEPHETGGYCVPADFLTVCAGYDAAPACTQNDRCRWLVPGCDVDTLPAPGCFPNADCGDNWCGSKSCTYVATEECVGAFVCL